MPPETPADPATCTPRYRTGARPTRSRWGRRAWEAVVSNTDHTVSRPTGLIPTDSRWRRADSKGVTIQVYRPTGRPRYATATADHDDE
jgi:hypothetical protein